jgi:glycosyltransferase involved in cell wall biosynthesis
VIPQPAKHLAIFIHKLSGGGAPRRVLTLAHAFSQRGHRVDLVVVSAEGPLLEKVRPEIRLVVLDSAMPRLIRRLKKQRLRTIASTGKLVRYLGSEKPDVLLSGANHVNLTALWARRLARVPIPLVLRASNHLSGSNRNPINKRYFRWWMARRVYCWADAVIAVSRDVAEDIARHTGIEKTRITTIYNPTITPDLAQKAKQPLDHPWFAPGSPPVILAAGRLSTQKDFPTLLKAFARIRAVRPARLVILGEGKKRHQLQALARQLGVTADVALPGFVDNPFAWMARAAVFALSSAWEGLPGVLIEALACGCPAVSTDCPGGAAEILADGRYGTLVPVGDDQALASALLSALDAAPDPELLRKRAAQFSIDRAVDQYLKVLTAVAA